MVLEYVAGGSLQDHEDQNFAHDDSEFLIRVAKQVAVAVQFLHSRKIAHRDIKCLNILLTKAGNAKLCDMGFGKEVHIPFLFQLRLIYLK